MQVGGRQLPVGHLNLHAGCYTAAGRNRTQDAAPDCQPGLFGGPNYERATRNRLIMLHILKARSNQAASTISFESIAYETGLQDPGVECEQVLDSKGH